MKAIKPILQLYVKQLKHKEMKTMLLKTLLCFGVISCFAFVANAQTPISTNVGVTARLATQLTVTKVTDVDFGGIFIPQATDVVATMDYNGGVTITTGSTALFATNLQQAGSLRVDSQRAAAFTVQYPATVELINGAYKLVYTPALYTNAGVSIPSSASTSYDVNTDEVGDTGGMGYNKLLKVAGTLAVATTANSGTYTGTVAVTVTWQ